MFAPRVTFESKRGRGRRQAFSLIELVVVVVLFSTIALFAWRGIRGNSTGASRTERLAGIRVARRILMHVEEDLRRATGFAAPSFNQAALTLIARDDKSHRVQYFNRNESGENIYTLADAQQAKKVSLVRAETADGHTVERILLSSAKLDYVLFKRLGQGLVGIEVRLDAAAAQLAAAENTSFHSLINIAPSLH